MQTVNLCYFSLFEPGLIIEVAGSEPFFVGYLSYLEFPSGDLKHAGFDTDFLNKPTAEQISYVLAVTVQQISYVLAVC